MRSLYFPSTLPIGRWISRSNRPRLRTIGALGTALPLKLDGNAIATVSYRGISGGVTGDRSWGTSRTVSTSLGFCRRLHNAQDATESTTAAASASAARFVRRLLLNSLYSSAYSRASRTHAEHSAT